MNKNLYRLVFSKCLGMFVPASEVARSRTCNATGSRVRQRRRALLAAASLASLAASPAAFALDPVALPTAGVITSGAGSIATVGSAMTVNQNTNKMIVNWGSFNIGSRASVNFIQPGRTSSVLNRIGGSDPSQIFGSLTANGNVYLVNTNGIVFGNGAQVNVGSLTASTLDVTDSLFGDGINSNSQAATFAGTTGFVRVEAGAAITAATGGRVMLLAPEVENSGVINTPDGQTILAAGQKVYLMDSEDPAGLLVEVDSGGTASNLGNIFAQRGNVTLVGLAVNQQGRISATTSVRANGSIHLLARDSVATGGDGKATILTQTVTDALGNAIKDEKGVEVKEQVYKPQRYGKVTVGQNSVTEVVAEVDDKEEVLDKQVFMPSRVRIEGRNVEIDGNISAKGGEVSVNARVDLAGAPAHTDPAFQNLSNRIYLGEHANIDVSGIDATAPMSRNQLEIQLFSEQLKDAPLQRGGALFGEKVYVDARKGTLLTDIDPYLALKGHTVAEKLSEGGTVVLNASSLTATPGDVVVRSGAVVDVSGGSVTYESGLIRESSVRYNGKLIPISEATIDKVYQGTGESYSDSTTYKKYGVTRTFSLANSPSGTMQQGYTDGSSAGTVSVAAVNAALQGEFIARTNPGKLQRETVPTGGTFKVAINNTIQVVPDIVKLLPNFTSVSALPGPQANASQIDVSLLDNGFSHLDLAGSRIDVNTAIAVAPEGSVTLNGSGAVNVNADVTASGGSVTITGGNVIVGNGVTVSTAGLWTNDTRGMDGAMTSPVVLDGGNVSITGTVAGANALTLGEGASIDASAGAWLDAKGKLKGGKGGNITLVGLTGLDEGQLQSYGFSKGGELSLSTLQDVKVGGQQPASGAAFWLSESFFGQGGFSRYTIAASAADATMQLGDAGGSATLIHPQMQNLQVKSGFGLKESGASMQDVASASLLPDYKRAPASVSFSAGDDLTVFADTTVRTDAPTATSGKGAISLASGGQMTIDGSLIAPAGTINASITGTTAIFDYNDTLSLFVGDTARLLAGGYYALTPSSKNVMNATVFGGGSVTLDGGQRAVVVTKAGSLIDVSGVSGTVDTAGSKGNTRETVYGAAGNIAVSSRNGLALDGDMRASAPGTGTGGSLAIAMTGSAEGKDGNDHPNGSRMLTVTQNKVLRAAGLEAGDVLSGIVSAGADANDPDDDIGSGAISAQQIATAGFDRVSLKVDFSSPDDKIVLPSGLSLNVPTSLTLDTGTLAVTGSGTASLSASSVALTSTTGGAAPVVGDASLKISANFIDLSSDLTVTGVKSTTLTSRKDIRGRGLNVTNGGSLTTPGELVLKARQIYPVTNGQFQFEATGADSSIKVVANGTAPATLLSAGGKLTLKADNIEQGGTLRAPLGEITLDAADTLTLKAGSLTSVSARGQLIPYGLTRLGGIDLMNPTSDLAPSENTAADNKLPEKKVTLKSAVVDMRDGATVDISGGGDTMAYEWIEGIGGSSDILGKAGVYAVIPTMQGEFAPFDYNYQNGSDLKLGDTIYLSGVPGLAAGMYTLLPGRYALLPGAFMVQASSASVVQGRNIRQADGATLVSGYRTTVDGAGRDAVYSTFKVTDGSVFRTDYGTSNYRGPSEYLLTSGNQFIANLAATGADNVSRIASDAGQLVLNAGTKLTLEANLLTGKAAGASGALVDIVSDNISVVSVVGADNGTLQLAASGLNSLAAESLLLGGTRTHDGNDMTVTTSASTVTFANDAAHALEVAELIAVASDTVAVNAGAVVRTADNTQATGTTRLHASGDGALLAVSSRNDIEYDRSGVSTTPVTGTLNVASGASVTAGRSMVLDSTLSATLDGNAMVDTGGTVTLGANRILLGDSGSATGMKVDDGMLANLGDLSKVTLNSYKNVDIYGPVAFGNDQLDITINAGGIARHVGASENTGDTEANRAVTLTARNFALQNSAGASFETPAAVAGSVLNINAKNITLAGGATTTSTVIDGYDKVNLAAASEARFSGTGATTINAAQTTVTSTRITASTGADYTLTASGSLSTANTATAAVLADADGLGAKLKLAASSVTLGGKVELPSGKFTAQATTGNLTVTNGASIKAASVPVAFDKYTRHTPGGSVTLQADAGSVAVQTGSTIDVSGGVGGNAGKLSMLASNGAVTVDGSLNGQAISGRQGGSFELDTGTLADFSALNSKLNAGGFAESRDMRVRNGDVEIAAGDTVTAREFVLAADRGKIDVAGTVNADGSNGGSIEIYARDNVTLKNTAQLLARGTGDATVAGDATVGAGGKVVLSSLSKASIDAVSAESGALIDVSGDTSGDVDGKKGSVTMRAYRGTTGNTNTVNVAFGATAAVKGAEDVRIEGVKVYESATFATTTSTIVADTNAFYTANPDAGSYAATQDGGTVSVLPNIEVRSTGTDTPTDLTIAADLNMRAFGALQAGKGGTLTLRSNKDLKINGSLSDGFSTATTAGLLQTGNTFSFDLVAGADFTAANTMATSKSETSGNFDLASNKLIRTGQGDIRIAAGGNITMGNEGSVIYTVGQAAADVTGFSAPELSILANKNGRTAASYLTDGGNIEIQAQGNITGKIGASGAQQTINQWLFRQGGGSGGKDVSWWVRPDLFKQGVAAFGGGNVMIDADGNITNFSASVPTTGRYTDDGSGNHSVDGGGNLLVRAGGDIKSGIYFAGRGDIDLIAGGQIGAATSTFGTTLALQDGSAEVSAVKSAFIETVFNPTWWAQASNVTNALGTTGDSSFFMTYGDDSAFRMSSLTGDVTLGLAKTSNITGDLASGLNSSTTAAATALEVHPGTVEATSFSGDIHLGRLVMAPSAQGNLSLLAAGDVSTDGTAFVAMSDASVALLPGVTNPLAGSSTLGTALVSLRTDHADTPVHANDDEPIAIVAKTGSITMIGEDVAGHESTKGPGLTSPKAAYLHAGGDITLNAHIQHVADSDLTVVEAGGDFKLPVGKKSTRLQVSGPGELLVKAGRNIDLADTAGILSAANTTNSALPDEGVNITLMAGLGTDGADVAGYIAKYISPAAVGSDTLRALAGYMRKITGNANLSEADARQQYLALDKNRQEIFAYRHLSSELLASGKGYAESGNHNRGDTAVAAMFSGDDYDGNLMMYKSQVRTLRGGSIDLLVPGGLVNAGVPSDVAGLGHDIGIVTERGGDIRAFAESGFLVNQSKVITQYGGDMTVWVNNGDIDAGRGSKTAVSVPKREVITDADGNTTVEFKGVAAGSGIRAQTYDPDGPDGAGRAPGLGTVTLIAPRGVLNVGEAGIGGGDIFLVAPVVTGPGGIDSVGSVTGAPVADTGSLAGVAGVSNVASDVTKAASDDIGKQLSQATTKAFQDFMPSIVTVRTIRLED